MSSSFIIRILAGVAASVSLALCQVPVKPAAPAHPASKAPVSAVHRVITPAHPVHPAAPALSPGLYAYFYTSMGTITCRLFDKDAPKTVANFRGLATGTKEWSNPRAGGAKTKTPLYSGSIFHRVIKGFMIQGGDPLGTGMGDPGYSFADEFSAAHSFAKPGVLAMANRGPNTNGSQFFITTVPTPWLDGHHTIFGEVVAGQEVADRISEVPVDGSSKPLTPVVLRRVTIREIRSGVVHQTVHPVVHHPIRKLGPPVHKPSSTSVPSKAPAKKAA